MAKPIFEGLRVRKHADKTDGERVVAFVARNFEVDEDGVAFFLPEDLERILYNPATPGIEHEPWPTAGWTFEGDAPKHARVPTSSIAAWVADGWVELENPTVVHRSGGPPQEPWRVTHTFVHADQVVFHTLDGDVAYRVVENPDKWPDEKTGPAGFGGEVRWYYDLERVS